MKNPNIKIGDLVSLEGLEKPEGALTVELGGADGKSDKVKKLSEGMSEFAGKVEDHQDVQVGQVADLVEAMKKALVRELSPEKAAELLKVLKKRFLNKKKPYKSAEGIKWEDVEKKLQNSPENMWSLQQMEDTGGEPDIVELDKKTTSLSGGQAGEYVFMDCSAESPKGRRNCVYDREAEEIMKRDYPTETCSSNAISMAALMGIEVLDEKQYRELQTKGEFDKNSWSWLKTSVDKRKVGVALCGNRGAVGVSVHEGGPHGHIAGRAWRGSLRV